jgi:hypothetical protein
MMKSQDKDKTQVQQVLSIRRRPRPALVSLALVAWWSVSLLSGRGRRLLYGDSPSPHKDPPPQRARQSPVSRCDLTKTLPVRLSAPRASSSAPQISAAGVSWPRRCGAKWPWPLTAVLFRRQSDSCDTLLDDVSRRDPTVELL